MAHAREATTREAMDGIIARIWTIWLEAERRHTPEERRRLEITTLLKLMLGLLKPEQGSVRLRGRRLSEIPRRELARQMAYVPQVHREAFGYRVFDVVLMGRMPHNSFFGRYGEADFRMVRDCLEKTGISHLAERSYTEISGGERQLTLVARAMAQVFRHPGSSTKRPRRCCRASRYPPGCSASGSSP